MRVAKIALLLVAWGAVGLSRADEVRQSEIFFTGCDAEISASVVEPAADGPHSGLVMVGGSGPADRTELMGIARRFAREGLVVLAYDKRGTGKSGGNWVTSSLDDLACDARTAFRTLEGMANVDEGRVGYWGISQAGWVLPLAAATTAPAFAIVVSGGGLSPRKVETRNYLSTVERVDSDPSAEEEVRQLLARYFAYLGGEGSRGALMEKVEEYRNRAWFPATGIERVIPVETNRDNWAWVANFDPVPSIASMKAPVLVLLGGADPLTPAGATAETWNAALSPGVSMNRVVVVPGAGHGLTTGAHGGPPVPEFFEIQMEWLNALGMLRVTTPL